MKNNFEIEEDEAIIKINKNIYPKEILIQTTYVMLEDFYFLLDEDDKNYIIYMSYKDDFEGEKDLKKAVYNFFDELIESQSYIDQLKRTSDIRQTILEKALLAQSLESDENERDKN